SRASPSAPSSTASASTPTSTTCSASRSPTTTTSVTRAANRPRTPSTSAPSGVRPAWTGGTRSTATSWSSCPRASTSPAASAICLAGTTVTNYCAAPLALDCGFGSPTNPNFLSLTDQNPTSTRQGQLLLNNTPGDPRQVQVGLRIQF